MINALTIDVEDYYMVSNFADVVIFDEWGALESRIEKNTIKVLDLLDENGVKATFFILGWIAEHHPGIVREIYSRGHEIASHGYNHRLVYMLSEEEFRDDTRRSKRLLEDIIGDEVKGYRAASYSITKDSLWAIDILIEEGFTYDSSIFPVRHDRYGYPGFSRFSKTMKKSDGAGELLEIPPSTIKIFGMSIPVAGGGYLRLLPVNVLEWCIDSLNRKEGERAVIYVHPWEFDPDQPRLKGSMVSMFRHYHNIKKMQEKFTRLLKRFRFAPLRDLYSI